MMAQMRDQFCGRESDGAGENANRVAYLQAADERVVDLILEERLALVVVAAPAPHVLAVAVGLARVQHGGGEDPHEGAEQEDAEAEGRVVHGRLARLAVAAAPVRVEDDDADGQRDARNAQQRDLRPGLLAGRPRRQVAARRQRLGRVEDGEGGGQHGEDDERAAEVDAAEEELGDAHALLDSLKTSC